MSISSRSAWLPVCLLACCCLVYGVTAQTFAPPVIQRHDSVTAVVKLEDVVNITGLFPTPAGLAQAPLYTVPLNKRLVLTSVQLDEHNWAGGLDLVEVNAGSVTMKVSGQLAATYANMQHSNVQLTFPFPIGLRFEPGSVVALQREENNLFTGGEHAVMLVGVLVDAY